MKITVFGISDVGMRREKNEDSYLINKDLDLYMVADGMGGHVGGEFASKLAVKTIEDTLFNVAENSKNSILEENNIAADDFGAQLQCAIKCASSAIYDKADSDKSLKGMGTTAVVLAVRNDRVFIANVGDSRAYIVRKGEIFQLTEDHSLVGEQLRAGVISERVAKGHKLKNIITRSVGFQKDVEIDVVVKVPQEGDKYLLCSDGLTNMVEDSEILDVIASNSSEEACNVLVDMANTRGGDDNITLVLGEVSDVEDVGNDDLDDESTIGIT
jgi:protein phosphatase